MVETYFSNLANVSALADKDNKFTCRKKKRITKRLINVPNTNKCDISPSKLYRQLDEDIDSKRKDEEHGELSHHDG